MKTLLPLLAAFAALFPGQVMQAQNTHCGAPETYLDEADHILRHVDKNQIPTRTLYEAVFPWADVDLFDGSSHTDTSSLFHFFQAYSELFYASYSRAQYTHPLDYENAIKNFHADKDYHHAVGIIDFNYNSIRPDAVSSGLFTVSNGQLHDVPGRSSSPYLSKRAFLSAVLQANNYEHFYDGTHYFHFDPAFVLSNRNFQLSGIQYIDFFLDGSFMKRTYINGAGSVTVPLYFPPFEGESTLSVVYRAQSGGEQVARIKLKRKILKKLSVCEGLRQVEVTGDVFDGGYGTPAYGAQGKGYIFFGQGHCADQQLRKVVIFVDGFDPDNGRNVWDIWDTRINAEIRDANNNRVKFGEELVSKGYDVVVYDYDEDAVNRGGAGYIENNGIAFARFVEKLYRQYKNTLQQDFVVIAPSMAALVVRYGLAWAEQRGIAHHTRLYVSFDGPHQGAHVTAGVQQMVDQFTQYGGLKIFEGIKNGIHYSNAAKQMLLNHSSQHSETVQAHPYRQRFLNNLAAVGSYPNNLRKVAISDGNRNGVLKSVAEHGYSPCDDLFRMKIKKRLSPICFKCTKLSIEAFAQTDQSRCRSLEMRVNNRANLLKWLVGASNDDVFTYYSRPVYTNKSFDKAPGGMFGPEADFKIKWWQHALGWLFTGQLKLEQNLLPKSNFVPTVSSVDYNFSNEAYNIYKNLSGGNLGKCTGRTPFDSLVFAVPGHDFNHARTSDVVLEFLRSEIYYPKSKASCAACPDYLSLAAPEPANVEYRAARAITLQPSFSVGPGIAFRADIGCGNSSSLLEEKPGQGEAVMATCPFGWDVDRNQVACNAGGSTTFRVFVENMPPGTYAEFALGDANGNAGTWHRASYGDSGWEVTLPNGGSTQKFFARPKGNQAGTIQGWLSFCN